MFPEAFLNNPASMFGHSLLRVDVAHEGAPEPELLGFAVSFAGATGTDDGLLYAVKGLLGFYPGYFNLRPYYETVAEYGDWESRDIWEYRLALTPAEVERLLEHVWELEGVAFSYYYFDENCTWQLLGLLQVARPEARFAERRRPWVIPADALRALAEEPGLVAEVSWRPSSATRLRFAAGSLGASEQELARSLAAGAATPTDGRLAALPPSVRADVLALAYDRLRYAYLRGEIARDESAPRARALLLARSAVVLPEPEEPAAPPRPAVAPENGHHSSRASLGGGVDRGGGYLELGFRPALQDLLDPEGGYTAGAQVQMASVALRVYPDAARVRLEDLVLVDVESLPAWDRMLRPIAWRMDLGVRSRALPDAGDRRELDPRDVLRASAGGGLAFDPLPHLRLYGFAEAVAEAGFHLEPAYALAPGATLGVTLGEPDDRMKLHAYARWRSFVVGDDTTTLSLGLEQRFAVGRDTAIVLRGAREQAYGRGWIEGQALLELFF